MKISGVLVGIAVLLGCMEAIQAQEEPQPSTPPWGDMVGQNEVAPVGNNAVVSESTVWPDASGASTAPRFWARTEALVWYTKNGITPPLVTRGDSSDQRPGALDLFNTKLLNGGALDFADREGGRFTLGLALDVQSNVGIETNYFFLDGRRVGRVDRSQGTPVLARPFFNTATQQQDSSLVTYPQLLSGSIQVVSSSFLQGGEANLCGKLWSAEKNKVEWLAGFRFANLQEKLDIAENELGEQGAMNFAGRKFHVSDTFHTDNDFYGGQFGLRSAWSYKRLSLELLGKVALGNNHELVTIRGESLVDGQPYLNRSGGLLAVASDSGRFGRDAFAVVPEFDANFGLKITEHLTIYSGYTLLYWNQVIRPGDQVDLNVNPNQVPFSLRYGVAGGAARPAFTARESDYWAQGANFGIVIRY